MKDITVDFKEVGVNEIHIDKVVDQWNHLCCVSEWRSDDTWSLLKYRRIDSPNLVTRLTISRKQALELIEKLNLREGQSLRSGFTYRKEEHWSKIINYSKKGNGND